MISDHLMRIAAESYGFDQAACQILAVGREASKQLYTFTLNGRPYVLRSVKNSVGTRAEMDWLLYLADKGLSVPRPLGTTDGRLAVSARENGETYILSAFEMMRGKLWDKEDPRLWNRDIFYRWGKAVGDMHRFSKDYKPANPMDTRGAFHIRGMIAEKIKDFPTVGRIAEALLQQIESLPKDRDSYGLIHNDLHPNNFLIDSERICLLDFDGCAYSWYAFDIGNALYLALWLGRKNRAGTDFTEDIIGCFLRGYLSANRLSDFWLAQIPLFMMACKIALFSYGCDSENPGNEPDFETRQEQIRHIENNSLFTGWAAEDFTTLLLK